MTGLTTVIISMRCVSRTICCTAASRIPKRKGFASTSVMKMCGGHEGGDSHEEVQGIMGISSETLSSDTRGFLKAQQKLQDVIAKTELELLEEEKGAAEQEEVAVVSETRDKDSMKKKSFAELFQESTMVRLGDFSNQLVVGKIIARVEDELFIDYGGKFDCVCKAPMSKEEGSTQEMSEDKYQVGASVLLQIRDHEMTARFMGYETDMTLLEADAKLIGLHIGKKKESSSSEL